VALIRAQRWAQPYFLGASTLRSSRLLDSNAGAIQNLPLPHIFFFRPNSLNDFRELCSHCILNLDELSAWLHTV
jgi:hypothetical protein